MKFLMKNPKTTFNEVDGDNRVRTRGGRREFGESLPFFKLLQTNAFYIRTNLNYLCKKLGKLIIYN